jgi:TetR/AcrR family transcriptional regulator, transcriptional repressor for nem operon
MALLGASIVQRAGAGQNDAMKVTKEQVAENRAALVHAAGKLFRERGIDGVGVAEISKEAGLTHGALYAQFGSKEALAAEALAAGLERRNAKLLRAAKGGRATISDQLDAFLSKRHRDDIAEGCPIAASGSEVARQNEAVSASCADGFEEMAEAIEILLGKEVTTATSRERALALAVAEIGAIIVARAVAKSRPDLSEEILSASRHIFGELTSGRIS